MELWIRSQDKLELLKVNRISYNLTKNITTLENVGVLLTFNNEGCEIELGRYEPVDRALEVLDEIQKLITPQKILKDIENTIKISNMDFVVNPTYQSIEQPDTYVYEMPKK